MTGQRLPTLMIPHGGGPCFFMDPPAHAPHLWDRMAAYLRGLDAEIGRRPKAVLVISAHWETEVPTLHYAERQSLLFDYYNFPAHTYELTYPAKGAPEVARRAAALLAAAGIATAAETARGLDHGVFIPFKLIYPDADVPLVQLSLQKDLSPALHIQIGQALAPLRDEDVLIVGSGMTFHNLREIFSGRATAASVEFDTWLAEVLDTSDAAARAQNLVAWAGAPGARLSHPEEEHLLPLMVVAGAAGSDPGKRNYSENLGGTSAQSGFRFG
ncbi:MAG: class III extradiol ring-cleavage dioxygenase [Beijerinckiaceae bacterium]